MGIGRQDIIFLRLVAKDLWLDTYFNVIDELDAVFPRVLD